MIDKYPNYRTIKLQWFGEIPNHWNLISLKHLLEKVYGGGTPNTSIQEFWAEDDEVNSIPWVAISDITKSNGTLTETSKRITEAGRKDKGLEILPKGTLLMSIFASLGKTTILDIDATINQAILGLVPSKKLYLDFLEYLLVDAERYVSYFSSASTQENLNLSKIRNLQFPIPPIQEQAKIAQYLDRQCAIIDALIEKKEKLIELLKEKRQSIINEAVTKGLNPKAKMKDSGIEWLGEIPEDWEVKKIKQVADVFGRIGYRGYTTEDIVSHGEGAITISPSNMKGDFMTFEDSTYLSWAKYEESPEIKIFNDDVLMVKTGSTYGKIGIVKELTERATINPQVLVFKDLKIHPDFFFNILRTPLVQYQVETNVIGSTIPTISQAKILNFAILVPTKDEMDSIVSFIHTTSNKLDNLCHLVQVQIEKLKEYRQSIISEAVTGKVDVRNWEPQNN